MSFNIVNKINDERIVDLLCCGIEGGIGYWACIIDNKHGFYDINKEGWFILFEDVESGTKYKLDRDSLQRGLNIMSEKYNNHYSNFIKEDDDAETGDVYIQCCVLGEVVYG